MKMTSVVYCNGFSAIPLIGQTESSVNTDSSQLYSRFIVEPFQLESGWFWLVLLQEQLRAISLTF